MQKLSNMNNLETELSPKVQEQFERFAKNYNKRGGSKKHTAPAVCFIDFFRLCDKKWGDIPDYDALCNTLTSGQIDYFMPVFKWLVDDKKIQVDVQTATIITLKGGIGQLTASFGETPPTAVQDYLDYSIEKMIVKNIKPVSVRGTLQTAIYLYIEMGLNGADTPSQAQIDAYLELKRGVAPQLSVFCKFLNESFGTSLSCKFTKKRKPEVVDKGYSYVDDENRKYCEKAFIELAMLNKPLNKKQKLMWIDYGLKYFHRHDIHLNSLDEIEIQTCLDNKELMLLKHGDTTFAIPNFDWHKTSTAH